jgi:threonine/homoserine/homoserine lactone efflux protein
VGAAFLAGAAAGYAIAIPVGAIAILIVEAGLRRGFRVAAAAGAGAASADGLYATLAAAGGVAIAGLLDPVERPLKIVAVGVLAGIALRGLAVSFRSRGPLRSGSDFPVGTRGTYARFLGLTLLNPATVIYFAALIVGLPDLGREPAARAAFVAGAFLSSLSWQTTLAAIGSVAHHRLPPGFQVAFSVLGNLMILGFAAILAGSL